MRTKSQKVALALLGLAVVAFVVDRFVIGTDETTAVAAADEFEPARTASPGTAGRSVAAPQPAGRSASVVAAENPVASLAAATSQPASLASRLAALDQAMRLSRDSVADAFRPSAAWVAASQPPPPPDPAAAPAPTQKPAPPKVDYGAVFAKRHQLTALMNDGRGGMAIVNGRLYKVGQSVGGFRLIDVGLTEAIFLGKGTEVTLKLAGQQPLADVQ